MIFGHDTQLSLHAVVDLANSSPACGGREGLPDAASLRSFVTRHHVSEVQDRDYDDLAAIYRVRERFRRVFGLTDPAAVASRVNSLLAEAPVRPRLTDHDGYDWHVHYFSPAAGLAEHVAVDGGMALAHVVAAGETDRLRVCDASDCQAVLIDLSRNRSKRYCDARSCG
ncbi:MAG: CGNR zinc finger domain-containing protein, partial [Propionibacteriales bacterium]|nr:CGNR zinc finger domain-containing protein [Propionibacteriales bacterium]